MARRRKEKSPVEFLFGIMALIVFVAMINPTFRAKLVSFSASLIAFVALMAIAGLVIYLLLQMKKAKEEPIRYPVRQPTPSNNTSQPYVAVNRHNTTPEHPPQINVAPPRWDDTVLKVIEWKRFEIVTKEFLKMSGFEARETNIGADGGVDIRVYKPGTTETKGIVQCKAWNTYKVGVKLVRELFGVMAAEKVTMGMLITSGTFSSDAEEFAEGKIKLVSGSQFLKVIQNLPADKQQHLLDIALEGDYKTPTCPQCDIKMALRESSKGRSAGGQFWGCIRYPRCKQTFIYKPEQQSI